MAFRIGQKVVCVDDAPSWASDPRAFSEWPVRGAVYTVRGFVTWPDGDCGLLLEEIHGVIWNGVEHAFLPTRFRPVTEQKRTTSISIFKEILDRENHGLPSRVDYPCDVEGK